MFNRLLVILATAAILATPLLAQVPPEEAIQGTVVSLTDNSLTLQLPTGQHATYAIDGDTVRPANLSKGDKVSVQNLPGEGDDGMEKALEIAILQDVTLDQEQDTQTTTSTDQNTSRTATATATASVDTDADVDSEGEMTAEVETTATADLDSETYDSAADDNDSEEEEAERQTDSREDSYLPQTATPLAALAIAGLLALGGGVTIRRLYP